MNRFRFLTAGESHGQALTAIIEGIPAGLELSESDIAAELRRRQRGYGRGGRMKIEKDRATILSGVRYGKTLASPIALLIENRDWLNWVNKMSVEPVAEAVEKLQMPRPGHADFAGMIKYRHDDLRNILERSSARETAVRVAVGAVARRFLSEFGIHIYGHVTRIGGIDSSRSALSLLSGPADQKFERLQNWRRLMDSVEACPVACADPVAAQQMVSAIDEAQIRGDSLGGAFEIVALNVPVGLGSHVHWDRRLDGLIGWAMLSINAMKGVEIGIGDQVSQLPGSRVHDEIFYNKTNGYHRLSNHAGGIEGGMSNGEPIIVRVIMKPLPTLASPLQSVDAVTLEPKSAFRERSDVCAVPAAVVVAEAMLAITLADSLMEKLGGDSIAEMQERFKELPHVPLGW
ncbi:chorismate synthase [candidate division KSB1 bacterium]|nr:chorismate synthase [candidate division KSB1 bacterium]